LPQAAKSKTKNSKESAEGSKEEITVPTLSDILAPAAQVVAQPTEGTDEEGGEDVTKMTMGYLMKKDKDKVRLVQETIRILPELAKSENPLAAIMLEKLLEGGGGGGGDIEEFKDLAKAMTYTVILPELMKDVVKSVKGSGGGVDQATMLLLQALEERDKRLQQLLQEIKSERESKLVDEMRQEMYETMNTVVETFSKSIQELQQQMMAIAANQQAGQQPTDPFEAFERLIEYEEKAKQLLEKRGYKVMGQEELLNKLAESGQMDIEKEIKLKELQLKEKEIEARSEFYNRIGEALAKFAENPDNILRLINGLIQIFRGGPTNEQLRVAMGEASKANFEPPVKTKSSLPSLDSFVGGANGAE